MAQSASEITQGREMNTIDGMWDRMYEYWKIHEPSFVDCNGINDEEILSFEQSLQLKLPNDLKKSLKRCNAYPSEPQKVVSSSCCMTGGSGHLFSLETIASWYKDFNEYMYDGCTYEHIDPKLTPKDIIWSHEWLPIYSWNCDVIALLDLRKGIGEQYEQVLYLDQEYSTLGVWAKSYEEFLKLIADAIVDHGAFNRNDMEKVRQKVYNTTRN